jgi:hypothetical protein
MRVADDAVDRVYPHTFTVEPQYRMAVLDAVSFQDQRAAIVATQRVFAD